MARFIGTETEFGITCPTNPELSPIVSSTHAVVAYGALRTTARSRWDFAEEHPLSDNRGFDLKRYDTVPVVDPNAIGVANVVTPNGARFYVDHAHPEYSSPECADAWEAMVYDAAGLIVARQALEDVAGLAAEGRSILGNHSPCPPLRFYKNNVDGKGASYGSHENYLFSRDTDFGEMAQALIPFFTVRQVLAGAGRVGIGQYGEEPGFQISQRADYIEQEVSLETTLNRGIINTRNEPHAEADRFGRLHVIVGDANMSQTSNLLKLGSTSLVLDAIESGVDFTDLKLRDAVAEIKAVSHDPQLAHRLELADGRSLTALELLAEYRSRVHAATEADQRVLDAWDEAAAALGQGPAHAAHLLDWCAKYWLYQAYVGRGVAADDAKLAAIDIQYTDIDPARSLYEALVRKGQMRTLVTAEAVERAAATPPKTSRAFFRGRVTEKFGESVLAASWQVITLRCGGRYAQFRLDEVDALASDEARAVIESAGTVEELIAGLTAIGCAPEYRVA